MKSGKRRRLVRTAVICRHLTSPLGEVDFFLVCGRTYLELKRVRFRCRREVIQTLGNLNFNDRRRTCFNKVLLLFPHGATSISMMLFPHPWVSSWFGGRLFNEYTVKAEKGSSCRWRCLMETILINTVLLRAKAIVLWTYRITSLWSIAALFPHNLPIKVERRGRRI